MARISTIRRPLAVASGVLPCTANARRSPAIAAPSCQLWWPYCCFSTSARRLQEHREKQSDPLRILFCGTDKFSAASLQALYEEKDRNPGLIESINIVVRPSKHFGRGLKRVRHPPIREVAEELGLPIHERDTFTKWDMPPAINLIIAVSFGLLVPVRLLAAAKYGGLNVHPSLLPDLRGPAPLHHTLLRRLDATGVTLQTMHPYEFDKGLVLAQSRGDDLIQIPPKCTYPQLLDLVTPIAAQMLVQGLRDGVHVPPLEEQHRQNQDQGKSTAALHAPKIVPEDRNLYRFATSQSNEADELSKHRSMEKKAHPIHIEGAGIIDSIALAQRVIGPLWFRVMGSEGGVERTRRILLDKVDDDIMIKNLSTKRSEMSVRNLNIWETDVEPSQKATLAKFGNLWYAAEKDDDSIYLFDRPESLLKDSLRCLRVESLKVEGSTAKPAKQVLDHYINHNANHYLGFGE